MPNRRPGARRRHGVLFKGLCLGSGLSVTTRPRCFSLRRDDGARADAQKRWRFVLLPQIIEACAAYAPALTKSVDAARMLLLTLAYVNWHG